MFEFGAYGYGPQARTAADRLAAEIHTWGSDHRGDRAMFRAYPAGTPDDQLPAGLVIDKRLHRITISWPHHER
ncbi:MAG: hypothetical protein ACRDQ4_19545 [Pseudonocardiaceae bacterium]